MMKKINGISRGRADRAFDILDYVLLTLAFLAVAYPLYFVVIASISDPVAVYEGRVVLWPIKPTLEGYARIFSYESLFTGYRNTLLYTVVGTAINVVLTVTAGYALSRKELVGRNVMMMGVMFTMIFSGGMIPNYLLVRDLNLYNTMWALILPGAVSTWNLIVCRTFFQQTIPDELKEAAELDGCGDTSFFLRIVLPVSSAIIAVMILFYAVSHWNSYYNALLYLTSTNKYPLQLVLRNILIVNTLDDMPDIHKQISAAACAAQYPDCQHPGRYGERRRDPGGPAAYGRSDQIRHDHCFIASAADPVSLPAEVFCSGRDDRSYQGIKVFS